MSERTLSTWRLAGRISRFRTGLLCVSFVLTAVLEGSTLLTGWLLQKVFDALGNDAPTDFGIYHILAILAGVEAARLAVILGGVLRLRCWDQMRGLMRLNLLRAQLQSGGPQAGAPATSPGDAVSRLRDDVDDFLSFLMTAYFAAGKVVLLAGSMVIMVSIEPVIALAVVLPLVLVVVVVRLATGRIRAYRAAYRRASAAVTALLGEMFGAVLAVKAAHAGGGVLRRLRTLNERRRRAGLRDDLVAQLLSTFNRTTMDLSVGIVLLLAVPAMRRGDLSIGELALFVSYVSSLIWVPVYGGRLLARHRQAGVSVERLVPLLPSAGSSALVAHRSLHGPDRPSPRPLLVHRPWRDTEPSSPQALPDLAPLTHLTVSGLTAVHPGSGRGVRDLCLMVERGTFTVITGPAGAGKTTVLRALLGLLPREAGSISWNGMEVADPAAFFVPPRSAYVPQVPRLFSESLRDNLLLGTEDLTGLTAAVRTAVLDRDVASMPAGLDTEVGARGVRLSGGQVQRAAIARALVRRADLLVLDDVSSALDVETERRLWDRLEAHLGRTLLVVSNRPATIARADQVIRLDHGRVQPSSTEQTTAA